MTELDDLQDASFAAAAPSTASSFPATNRITGTTLTDYLARRKFAVVSSTRADGRPHATMSQYYRRGTVFWLPTVAGTLRARNIAAQPWVSLIVTEGDHDEHVIVIVEGPAQLLTLDRVPADVIAEENADWVSSWLRLEATRLLTYAADGALDVPSN